MSQEKFLDDLIIQIAERNLSSIFKSDLEKEKSIYRNYCLSIAENKPSGFLGSMAFYLECDNEFSRRFKKLGIAVKEDPVEPLHDYEHQLKDSGLSRLSELEKKLGK
jgi:hypothetical protein